MSITQIPSEDSSIPMDNEENRLLEDRRDFTDAAIRSYERAVRSLHQQYMERAMQSMDVLRELYRPSFNLRHQEMERAWRLRLDYNLSCMSLLEEGNRDCFWAHERMLASHQTNAFQWGVTRNNPFSVNHNRAYYRRIFCEWMNYDSMSSEQIDYFQATASVPGWFRAPPNSLAMADAPPMNTTSAPPLADFNTAIEVSRASTFYPWRTHDLVPSYHLMPPPLGAGPQAPASIADYSVPPTPGNTPERSNTPMSILPDSELDNEWVVPPTPYNSPQKPKVANVAPATGNKTMLPPRTPFNSPENSGTASPIWVVTPIGTRSDGAKVTSSYSYSESPFQRKSDPKLSPSELLKSSTPEEKSTAKSADQFSIPELPAVRRSGGFPFGGSDKVYFSSPERRTPPCCPQVFGDDEGSSGA
ncbi:hypothetical protein LQW54_004415 [Pestalotiopsis sp. IQ-011]